MRRKITYEQFIRELTAQDPPRPRGLHAAFICPVCRTVQSAQSLIDAGAGADFDAVEKYVGFSCIGRWTNAGPYREEHSRPGAGCDWTLGGLFHLHELEVETEGARVRMCFEIGTHDEAMRLADSGPFQAPAKVESGVGS